jgi:hypothetical protein
LLLEGEVTVGEGDVVIGGKQSDQGDHAAAEGFQQAFAIETQQRAGRVRGGRLWLGRWLGRRSWWR